jgi:orotidine-5'-phosphate decarboxylase
MNSVELIRNPIIASLDLNQVEAAYKLAQDIGDIVGALKVGPRLVMREGQSLIKKLSQIAPVFVDMKHFDIPTTMRSAIQASFDAGATLVTVHALSGKEALEECAELEAKLAKQRPFKVLAVTVLTSWTEESYPPSFQKKTVGEHVLDLATLAEQAGLSGLVCSGQELDLLAYKKFFKVVPGIRLDQDDMQDQKRIIDPKTALSKGANGLVIGRPILHADNPRQATIDFVEATKA